MSRCWCGRWKGVGDGDIETYEPHAVELRAGRIDALFGASHLTFVDGVYRLRLGLAERPVTADLTLRPISRPAVTRSVPLGRCQPMQWLVVPRLAASGEIRVGSRRFRLRDTPAYHDHNWGQFSWGGDFAWEWGIALQANAVQPWSLIYYRITDQGRNRVRAQGLLLWRGRDHCRSFRDHQVAVGGTGLIESSRVLCVPRVMGLAIPGTALDIPRSLEVEASQGDDDLRVDLELDDFAQVGVPNDIDDGLTSISETHGRARVTGTVRGESVAFESPALVEFNRAV